MAVQMRLELDPCGETLCGRVTLEGEPPRGFTGWIGFNAVVDGLLAIAAARHAERSDAPPGDAVAP